LIACEIRQEFGDADEGAWKRERKMYASEFFKLQEGQNETKECINPFL
jgi:hypothetical protein